MKSLMFGYLLTINAVSFLLMLADKQRAKKHRWRIPEATLMLSAALGGSIGCLLGMYTIRHKTRKPKFYIGVPAILAVQTAILIVILR